MINSQLRYASSGYNCPTLNINLPELDTATLSHILSRHAGPKISAAV